MLLTDHYYEIGNGHTVCQDYALSGLYGSMGYAIVADGCSGSEHSDFGARIVSHVARDVLCFLYDRGVLQKTLEQKSIAEAKIIIQELIVKKLLESKAILNLNSSIFYSTLLIGLILDDDAEIPTHLCIGWGDGYFITKHKSGTIRVIGNTYSMSAPYYLSYQLSPPEDNLYDVTFKDQICQRVTKIIENNEITEVDFRRKDIKEPFVAQIDEDYFTDLIVTSDGIDTFYKKSGDSLYIPFEETLVECVNYKNYKGSYVQRRIKNSVVKRYALNGVVHFDDLSFAAIRIEKLRKEYCPCPMDADGTHLRPDVKNGVCEKCHLPIKGQG